MNKEKIYFILSFLAVVFGIVSIIFLIMDFKLYGMITVLLYIAISYFLIYIIEKRIFFSMIKLFIALILYPFYPIILYFRYRNIKPLYKPIDFGEDELIQTKNVNFSSVDLAPFHIILKYGDPAQRKYVVRLIYNSIKSEKIDFIYGIKLLREAIKIDSHPDVVLYASDALSNLENFLVEKISYYMNNLNTLEDYINYGKYSYYYANSGFLAGEHKIEVLWQSLIILRASLEVFIDSPKLIITVLKILESLEEYEELENMLEEYLEKFKAQEIYEFSILYYIKRKNQKKVQKVLSEFLELQFSPKEEAIRYMLGG